MSIVTKTDAGAGVEWRINDLPTQFRVWASETVHHLPALPDAPDRSWTIGAADDCWLQIIDPKQVLSRHHASLTYDEGRWVLSDLRSKNGLWMDGARRLSIALAPGMEIRLGGVRVIVESPKFMALRSVLRRLIGWSPERQNDVDVALRLVRAAATQRSSLILCGEGDLVDVARLLHNHTRGEHLPFVVCDPRRKNTDGNARSAMNHPTGMSALAAAGGGTLCMWQSRRPTDFREVLATLPTPSTRAQVVMCTHTVSDSSASIAAPVIFPPLSERTDELERIVDEFTTDAISSFGWVGSAQFRLKDPYRLRILQAEASTLAEIEVATRRVVALAGSAGGITEAAALLNMSHAALSEWIARRMWLLDD